MKKIPYTSEETFQTEEIEFSEKHFNVAKQIHELFDSPHSIIVRKDLTSLAVFVSMTDDRIEREKGINTFRITIEEIKNCTKT